MVWLRVEIWFGKALFSLYGISFNHPLTLRHLETPWFFKIFFLGWLELDERSCLHWGISAQNERWKRGRVVGAKRNVEEFQSSPFKRLLLHPFFLLSLSLRLSLNFTCVLIFTFVPFPLCHPAGVACSVGLHWNVMFVSLKQSCSSLLSYWGFHKKIKCSFQSAVNQILLRRLL